MTEKPLELYRVSLEEEPGDKFMLIFDCYAEDTDHIGR
jgi:hypothetical protein